ncbi:cytochrome P450 [Myxosarcina sp. GI1(2024)]
MKLPPKLNKSPLWQKLTWVIDPVKYLETAAGQYPDLYMADAIGFGGKFLLVNHPQAIQEILASNRQTLFASSRDNNLLRPLLGDNSVILLEGDPHRKRRKLLLPPFHGERMETYGRSIRELTVRVFGSLTSGEIFTARNLTQAISLQTILQIVYGMSGSDRARKLSRLISEMADVFRSPLTSGLLFLPWLQRDWGPWSPWGYFVRLQAAVDEVIYAEIAHRREQNHFQGEDILSMLMSARDEAGEPMSDGELRDELMSLMFAGHETTATAIAWALYWVHHLPEVKAKLLEEIDSLGDSPEPIAIAKLPYLDAVCKETLRIYPVAMLTFPRVVQQPMQLLDYDLEPGTVIMGNIFSVHQREDIYPQAKQFRPERFLERQFAPGEFVPFGGGARRCIGEALAQFELKLVLATVVSQYQLALASNRPEKPQRRGVTLAPAGGVKMQFQGVRTSQRTDKSIERAKTPLN